MANSQVLSRSPNANTRQIRRMLEAQMGVGDLFFLNSAHAQASDNNNGFDPNYPFATLNGAVAKMTADADNVCLVAATHAETIIAAGGATVGKAGLTFVGLGRGTNRPTFTFGTAATADFLVSAARCTLTGVERPWGREGGFRFVSNINDLGMLLDVNEGQFSVQDCEFTSSSAKEYLNAINLATTKDDFAVRHCVFRQPTDPAGTDGAADTGAIFIVDSENIRIESCEFYGNFETACIHNRTTACKNIVVKDCFFYSALSGSEPFQLVDGAEGMAVNCFGVTPAEVGATEATLVGTLGAKFFTHNSGFGNDGDAGGQGAILPTAAS